MKKGILSIIIGLLLITAALSLTGYNFWNNHRAGVEAEKVLNILAPEIASDPIPKEGRKTKEGRQMSEGDIEYPDYVLNPNMDMPVKFIDGGYYIGKLNLPAINIELPVCENWDYSNLNIAPCRYAGSVYLDNIVICAHNFDNHFGQIKNLSYGDAVIFTDMDGNVFEYEVMEVDILQPDAVEEMKTGDWDLTLFTCTVGGSSRVTVRCEKIV